MEALIHGLTPWLTAIGAALVPIGILIGAARRAGRAASLGTEQATTKYIATLKGDNEALTAENAHLRTDLAGCESEKRGLLRALRDQPSD